MRLRRRFHPPPEKFPVAVICVGNIHLGGTGKTPLVIEIARHFRNCRPVVVSRGYRSRSENANVPIDLTSSHGVEMFGDEPWMIANAGIPVVVGKRRRLSMEMIIEKKMGGLVLMDDGFQNLEVKKDIAIVVISGATFPRESFCFPAGSLREDLSALKSASAIVITTSNGEDNGWREFLAGVFPRIPLFEAGAETDLKGVSSESLGAFCGIAHPGRFFSALAAHCTPLVAKTFPDHHAYSERQLDKLIVEGDARGVSAWVTTDKDWSKVAPYFEKRRLTLGKLTLRYRLEPAFWTYLDSQISFDTLSLT